MSGKLNCWEIKKCGREPGGKSVDKHGPCPAATDNSCDGVNGGKNGGRLCWSVAGTFCEGEIQGLFALKIGNCIKCQVFQQVSIEEDDTFVLMPPWTETEKA